MDNESPGRDDAPIAGQGVPNEPRPPAQPRGVRASSPQPRPDRSPFPWGTQSPAAPPQPRPDQRRQIPNGAWGHGSPQTSFATNTAILQPAAGFYYDRSAPPTPQTPNSLSTVCLVVAMVIGALIVVGAAIWLLVFVAAAIALASASVHPTGSAILGTVILLLLEIGNLAIGIGILRRRETARVWFVAVTAVGLTIVALVSYPYYEFFNRFLPGRFFIPWLLVALGIPISLIVFFTRPTVKALFT